MTHTYAEAGVDIQAADQTKSRLKKIARATFGPAVLSDLGHFGGMFRAPGGKQPVLVSSVDGVGTKLKIAAALNKYDTVGQDLVNHCVNDILCCGATPLFFLDYIAVGKLMPGRVEQLVEGLALACKEQGCALIGGETAEMPGIYAGDDFDLAGFIVGVVERDQVKNGKDIVPGDVAFGLPSNGLHTNGYSLARKVLENESLSRSFSELGGTLGEALLRIHRCYLPALRPVLPALKGLAHITGGGLEGNVNRILPTGAGIRIHKQSWDVPAVFNLIQARGGVAEVEMYRVFNMGVGMVVICSLEASAQLLKAAPDAFRIGEVVGREELNAPVVLD